jgi:hypothetical protein
MIIIKVYVIECIRPSVCIRFVYTLYNAHPGFLTHVREITMQDFSDSYTEPYGQVDLTV